MVTVAELAAEVSVTGVDEAGRQLDGFGKKIDDTGSKHTSAEKAAAAHEASLRRVGTASLVTGGALLAGFGMAAGAASQLDTAMAPIGTLLGANSKAAAELRDRMTEMIASSPQSADEIGMSAYTILSAGISGTTNVMDALRASQKLSEAGLGSMADATGLVTSAMNAFKGESLTADGAARTLFGTITLGKTTTADLAQGFGEIAPLAAAAGVKFKDLLAATAALTATGQSASVAYTGIRGAITNIIKPTADAAAAAKQLGLDFSSAHLQNVGLPKFLDEVKAATGGNVDTMAKLFGSVEGVNAVLALTGPQADAFAENLKKIDGAGKGLNDRAGEMEHTLSNTLSTLANKGQVALAQGIQPMIPALGTMVDLAGGAADAWSSMPGPLQEVTGGLVAVTGVGLTAFGLFQKFTPVISDAKEMLRGLGSAGSFAADNIGRIAGAAGIALVAYGEIKRGGDDAAIGIAGMAAAGALAGSTMGPAGTVIGGFAGAIAGAALAMDSGGRSAKEYADAMSALATQIVATKNPLDALTKFQLAHTDLLDGKDSFKSLIADLRALAEVSPTAAQKVLEGAQAAGWSAGEMGKLGAAVAGGTEKFKAHAVGAQEAATGDKQISDQALVAAGAISETASAWDTAATAAKNYKTVIDNVLGIGLDVESTNLRWRDSIDAITKSLQDNGATLDINTQAGRNNREALLNSTQAALSYAEAQIRQTGDIGAANGAIGMQIAQLMNAATQAGLSGDAALAYTEDILGIPPEARTDIHNTADLARYATLLLENKYNDINGRNVNTTVTADTSQAWAAVNSLEAALNRLRGIPAGMPGPVGGPFASLGAHGLVGLARGGVAGQIVGPHQPVVIGEGLSREAVVPFDNFGDMVATIAATGRAQDFVRASFAAAGFSKYAQGGSIATLDGGVAGPSGAFTDPTAAAANQTAEDMLKTQVLGTVGTAVKMAIANFWQAQDDAQRAADAAIYRNLQDFLDTASVTADSVRGLMKQVLDDFWTTTDEAQRQADADLFKVLQKQLESLDTTATPAPSSGDVTPSAGAAAKPQTVIAQIDWQPLLDKLDELDKDAAKNSDSEKRATQDVGATLSVLLATVLGATSPAATIGAL